MSENDQKWNTLNDETPIPPDVLVVVRVNTTTAPVFKATIRLKRAFPYGYLDLKMLYTLHHLGSADVLNPRFLNKLHECKFDYATSSKSIIGTLKITDWRFLAEPSNLTIICNL
jgi:hypothetical protein